MVNNGLCRDSGVSSTALEGASGSLAKVQFRPSMRRPNIDAVQRLVQFSDFSQIFSSYDLFPP